MKNIHVLSTDKPSRLIKSKINDIIVLEPINVTNNTRYWEYLNIYITSNEEIKEGDWVLGDYPDNPICKVIAKYGQEFTAQSLNGDKYGLAEYDSKKIILTTDQDLIKNGVQAIDDTFLEWFVKNPSCESVEVVSAKTIPALQLTGNGHCWWKIIIPKKEPKQETLEEFINSQPYYGSCTPEYLEGIEEGAKWQAERMYSEEEVINLLETQRGNSYVAVLSATKNDELASIALNAPEPGGMKKFKKK